MNTAETNILTNPATQPGVLAPITRIGGGEVRVDRALALDDRGLGRDRAGRQPVVRLRTRLDRQPRR